MVDTTPKEREILEHVEIPPRPKALMIVSEEAEKDEPSFPCIAHAIAEDVSISAAVLKVVNSAAFRRPNVISSINQALNLLGIKRVLSVVNAVSARAVKTTVDLEDFWEYCSVVAHSAVLICKQLKMNSIAGDAYTLGLFHAAGVPLLMNHFDDYKDFFGSHTECNWNRGINEEMDQFHTTHSTVGALMAQDWNLPDPIVEAIYNVHYLDGILGSGEFCEEALNLIAILKMARHIAKMYQNPGYEDDEWSDIEGQILEFFGLDDFSYSELQEEVVMGLAEEAAQ